MSGTTISSWSQFEAKVFRNMDAPGDSSPDIGDVYGKSQLSAQVDQVKQAYTPSSAAAYVLKCVFSLGVYALYNHVKSSHQKHTLSDIRSGIDNVHKALTFLTQTAAANARLPAELRLSGLWDTSALRKPIDVPGVKPLTLGQDNVPEDSRFSVLGNQFVSTRMGDCTIDMGMSAGGEGVCVRITDRKGDRQYLRIQDADRALNHLENSIVRDRELFGDALVERVICRYDSRLAEDAIPNSAGGRRFELQSQRSDLKQRQLELCKELLRSRSALTEDQLGYLDRGLARDLALQVARGNVKDSDALQEHYLRIISKNHIGDHNVVRLYDNLNTKELSGKLPILISLPAESPKATSAGRPDADQQPVHNFAADLLMTDDIQAYDKDVSVGGHLSGKRMRNVFKTHAKLITELMDERNRLQKAFPDTVDETETEPKALRSLDPSIRRAVIRLIDSTLRHKELLTQQFMFEPNSKDFKDQCEEFIRFLDKKTDEGRSQLDIDDLSQIEQHEYFDIGEKAGAIDKKEWVLQHNLNVTEKDIAEAKDKDRQFDSRRGGKANFFSRIEQELEVSLDSGMQSVQEEIKRSIADVFPKEDPAANDPSSDLDTILSAQGNDPQMKLLKQTLDVYFSKMPRIDQRNMLSHLVRNTVSPELGATPGLRFGELLKGSGPVLQKMLQGLDPSAFADPDFRRVLEDMRSNLPGLSEQTIRAYLADILDKAGGSIESIDVLESLGAASVGQTLLCSVKFANETQPREWVVKLLRPDADMRARREAEVFREVAAGIPGMSGTFEGRFQSILGELNLAAESQNISTGLSVYEYGENSRNKTFSNVDMVHPVGMLGPEKGCLILEQVPGRPLDKVLQASNAETETVRSQALQEIRNAPENTVVGTMLDAAETLGDIYRDIFEKHDALANLAKIWIREGLFTDAGFYHGDLHLGNIMANERKDLHRDSNGRPLDNKVTMIDFGNATVLSEPEQKNVVRVVAGAAGNDPALFLKGLRSLFSADSLAQFEANEADIRSMVTAVLAKGTGNDAGKRMSAVFRLLQNKYAIEVPAVINNFLLSQTRLGIAMESTLRAMTTAEMRRLDVILAAARKEGMPEPQIAPDATMQQQFEAKRKAALGYLDSKLQTAEGEEQRRLQDLIQTISDAETQKPETLMNCMVTIISQNILATLMTLGTNARTVQKNLTRDGIIGNNGADRPEQGTDRSRVFGTDWEDSAGEPGKNLLLDQNNLLV